MNGRYRYRGLSGNELKIIAAAAMTVDHLGLMVFPQYVILRIIGRLSFPIFAYMIGEGFLYTKNRKRYFLTMAAMAAVFQIFYFAIEKSLYMGIFVTFSLSIGLCFVADNVMKKKTAASCLVFAAAVLVVFAVTESLPRLLKGTDFCVDYGFWGAMLPVAVFLAKDKWDKLLAALAALIMLSWVTGGIQWWCLCALLLLALYNGKRGRLQMKNFFYIYYPLHLVAIYLLGLLLR